MLILLISLSVIPIAAFDVFTKTLDGVSYQNTATNNGLNYLSLMGGAPIVVSGSMIANRAASNTMTFEPQWLSGAVM